MRTLYHFPLCPFSRKVRIFLSEKQLTCSLVVENFWEKRPSFSLINPAMQVPVLIEDGLTLADSYPITEYLEEKYPSPSLSFLGTTPTARAETRRLIAWFDQKFFQEVTRYIVNEKVIRYYTGIGQPLSDAIRAAKVNLIPHLEYIAFLTRDQKCLTGDTLTLADITAAAHLSVLDYLNEINWNTYSEVKDWYALIKSRPSFRPLLADRTPGFHPPKCYADLDF